MPSVQFMYAQISPDVAKFIWIIKIFIQTNMDQKSKQESDILLP